MSPQTSVLVLDLCGIFVFALSGAMAGIKHRLDLFGALVLSFAAANVGGITLQFPSAAATIAGAALCFGLRFMAIRRGGQLPVARRPERS